MKKKSFTLFNSALLSIGLLFTSAVYSADITYAVATGNWTDAANWSPQAPVAADNIIIPEGAIVTVSSDLSADKFNSLSVLGSLVISSSGVLTIEQTLTKNPIVSIGGGEIQNAGTFTIKQTLANNNSGLRFVDGTDANAIFTNTGIFDFNLSAGTHSATSGNCIGFYQTAVGRFAKLTFGGTMTFAVPALSRFIEMNKGNAEIDGTVVVGSAESPNNFRFIHFGGGGETNLVVAATADLTFYSGFVSSNGAITFSNTFNSTCLNKGAIKVHGISATGYGIYVNPQAGKTSTLTNEGTITLDGDFPLGSMYLSGSATAISSSLINQAGAILTLKNSGTATTAVPLKASATLTTFITNAGTLNLSSSALDASINTAVNTFSNTGTVNFNVTTDINSTTGFSGKVFANGQQIVVNLPSNENAQLVLTDIVGKTIKTAFLQGDFNSISTSGLKGIYIVRIITAKGAYSQKVSI